MLAVVFFIIALLYATIGFGGGSSYLATLAYFDVPFEFIPKIGLICNLLVVSGGIWHYFKKGHINKALITPFVISSVPAAFLGGLYPIKEKTFLSLLAALLLLSGLRLLVNTAPPNGDTQLPNYKLAIIIGALLGLVSGLVGLGGGIFLSPLMLNLNWGKAKEVAATASVFILVNSLAGLAGQMFKGNPSGVLDFWPLYLSVIVGGQIGSRLGTSSIATDHFLKKATGLLVLFIAVNLFLKKVF